MFPIEKITQIVEGELLYGEGDTLKRAIHDSRLVKAGDLFVALPGLRSDGHRFLADAFDRGASAAIVSSIENVPDNARNLIVVTDPGLALQQLASAWRDTLTDTLFVAITGSNGKTTVKALLGHLLSAHGPTHVSPHNYNTEIGLPVALLSMPATARFGVFELGAELPGDIRRLAQILRPHLGVITAVGPSHLDRLHTLEGVADEKWSLVESLARDGTAIVNADSPHLKRRMESSLVPIISAGLDHGDFRGVVVRSAPTLEVNIPSQDITLHSPLLGRHNAGNLLLAAAAARALGMSWSAIAEHVPSFEPMPHRLNPIRTSFGTILDDTYNANPASMTAALDVLASFDTGSSVRLFVFGEMFGLGGDSARFHLEIAQLALSLPIYAILPIGDAAVAACHAAIALSVGTGRHEDGRIVVLPRHEINNWIHNFSDSMVVLVKGSRALTLEDLVDELRNS